VVNQQTEEAFEQAYQELKRLYADQQALVSYLDAEKYPKRQQFVKAFTSKHSHFGHIATSRGEGGHYSFKRYLQTNRHDLLDLKDKWSVMMKVFLNDYAKDLALGRDRIHHSLNAKRWPDLLDPELNKQVVPAAMQLLVNQLHLMKDEVINNKPCTGNFETVFRMPCYHTLRAMKQLNSKVDRSSFHSHWHFERPGNSPESGEGIELPQPSLAPPGPLIFAPYKVVTRGRKRKDNSTRRNRSQFEHTAGTQRPGRVGGETSRVGYHPPNFKIAILTC